jgi:uncharacterized membrane protein
VRPLRFVSPVITLLVVTFAVTAYGDLPSRVPMRLGVDGIPGNFQERSLWSWFLFPAIAVALQVLFSVLTRIIPRRPELFTFPEKDRFRALPRENQAPVVREMILMLDATAIGVQGLMLLVLVQLWDAARGAAPGAGIIMIPVAALLLAPVILLLVGRVSAAVEREEKKLRT